MYTFIIARLRLANEYFQNERAARLSVMNCRRRRVGRGRGGVGKPKDPDDWRTCRGSRHIREHVKEKKKKRKNRKLRKKKNKINLQEINDSKSCVYAINANFCTWQFKVVRRRQRWCPCAVAVAAASCASCIFFPLASYMSPDQIRRKNAASLTGDKCVCVRACVFACASIRIYYVIIYTYGIKIKSLKH